MILSIQSEVFWMQVLIRELSLTNIPVMTMAMVQKITSLQQITVHPKRAVKKRLPRFPANTLPYCIITRHDGFLIAGWNFDICETPAYFMQVLAAKMAGTIDNYRFVVELDITSRYQATKLNLIRSAIGGLEHPHYTESYYILALKMGASVFQ